MGMYTELYIAVELKKDMPQSTIDYLKSNIEGEDIVQIEDMPQSLQLGLLGNSYYFDSISMIEFNYDTISNSYYLTMVANHKNYRQEWEWLLNWLEPYITSSGHIGHYRYEEDEIPTLLFYKNNKIVWKDCK